MSDTTLTLGNFEFEDFEVPERIGFGGEQRLNVQRFPGGGREVQAMGPDPRPLTWSGRFRGSDATDLARQVDAIRKRGLAVELAWSVFLYDVVVQSFQAEFERFYEVPYQITCEVVRDHTSNQPAAPVTADQMFRSDLGDTSLFGGIISDLGLDDALASVQDAAQDVLDSGLLRYAGEALSVTGAITGGTGLISTASSALGTASTALFAISSTAGGQISGGSLVSGASAVASMAGLQGAAQGLTAFAAAQQLGYRLTRMGQTLGAF